MTKADPAGGRISRLTVAVMIIFLVAMPALYADAPVTMAPPVADANGTGGGNAASESVFNWSDVPPNQEVPITRGTFDQGGYQLYDSVGETIIVPFANENLYVMKFAVSDNGTMYFVNAGSYPVLYVPRNGYLENATVGGARWYPFSDSFHPTHPVFVGIAPSWDAFVGMGWYPHMAFYGGYYCHSPWVVGAVVLAAVGLFVLIDGHHYDGWSHYHDYYTGHPGWVHPTYFNRSYYHWAAHPAPSRPSFMSSWHQPLAHAGFGGRGAGPRGGSAMHGAGGFRGIRGMSGFRGGNSSGSGGFHGAPNNGGGGSGFRGTGSFHGGASGNGGSGGSFRGSSHTFRGAGGGGSTNGSSHTFRGSTSGGSSHSFGGNSHSSGGGSSHSFSGRSSGGHGGSGHSSGHSSGGHSNHQDHGH